MKKIKLKLDYKCFPVWVYNDNNDLIANDLPNTLINDIDIDSRCIKLQEMFDSLYLNNGMEFSYIGFEDAEKKRQFINNLNSIEEILRKKVGPDYEIINDIDEESL